MSVHTSGRSHLQVGKPKGRMDVNPLGYEEKRQG
jgi:hypothetical protein